MQKCQLPREFGTCNREAEEQCVVCKKWFCDEHMHMARIHESDEEIDRREKAEEGVTR